MKRKLLALAVCSALVSTTGLDARGQVARPSADSVASPLAGRYQLVRIDGHPIPFAARDPHAPPNAAPPPEVVASTLVIKLDGSFLMAMAYRHITGGEHRFWVTPFSGTCARGSDAFVARWDGAGETRLSLVADTLMLNNAGMQFAYRKLR